MVIATGGNPTGIAEVFSLPLTPLRPVLCPVSASVVGDRTALGTLDGLRVRARLTLSRSHEELWREDGEVLFRAFGISGVAAFNLSRRINQGDTVLIDFFPDFSKDELLDTLEQRVNVLGDFRPETPTGLTACSPRSSHTSSVRHSSGAIPARAMSSTWSQSSSTLNCPSKGRQRSAQHRSRVAAYLSSASRHPIFT